MDVVYVVGEQEPNTELTYSLRSLAANVPHSRVFIAGYLPKNVVNVNHIPTGQHLSKWENSARNLLAAVKDPRLSEEFQLWNDDFYALSATSDIPALYRDEPGVVQSGFLGMYRKGALATEMLLREDGITGDLHSYEMHIPFVYEKPKVRDLLERTIRKRLCPCIHWRSYYGNLHNIGGEVAVDVKWHRHNEKPTDTEWLSSSPHRWPLMIADLRQRFPRPCIYER